MEQNSAKLFLTQKIAKGEEVAPFLFVSKDLSKANAYARLLSEQLAAEFGVDKNYIFTLSGGEESLKMEQVREFLLLSNRRSSFAFQIFIVEQISQLTLQSANAMLKFLEEPGVGNIVFLTNESEGGVLETILSRVKVIPIGDTEVAQYDEEIYTKIRRFVEQKDVEIISYFYAANITKEVAKSFLFAVLMYLKNTLQGGEILKEIDDDIQGLEKK